MKENEMFEFILPLKKIKISWDTLILYFIYTSNKYNLSNSKLFIPIIISYYIINRCSLLCEILIILNYG